MGIIGQIASKGFVRIVPRLDIDSIFAASILFHNLAKRNVGVVLNLDLSVLLENRREDIVILNLPPPKGMKPFVISPQPNSSLTASVSYEIEREYGIPLWDKILSIAVGVFTGYDIGREGFKGVEKSFLNELLTKGVIEQDLGFRFWGYKRVSIVKAITRTLIPPIPGVTGRENVVRKILEELKIRPDTKASETGIEQDMEKLKKFMTLLESNTIGDKSLKDRIQRRLAGFVYATTIDGVLIDLYELIGAILVYIGLYNDSFTHILMLPLYQKLVYDILNLYEDIIDEIVVKISRIIEEPGRIIEIPKPLSRPEPLIEALRLIQPGDVRKPFIFLRDGDFITTASELLRAGYPVEEVYSHCDPYQLCRVKEDGSIVKS
ncbi:hypothetical protein ACSU1N_03330 [Thermogladius sp. 4427co]|uniref:hypothetical protein n=1 Tax=Thermogladius sp. 4427co TaxID=3450718 RepID=UPI003F798363